MKVGRFFLVCFVRWVAKSVEAPKPLNAGVRHINALTRVYFALTREKEYRSRGEERSIVCFVIKRISRSCES